MEISFNSTIMKKSLTNVIFIKHQTPVFITINTNSTVIIAIMLQTYIKDYL